MCVIASKADLIKFMMLPEGTSWTKEDSSPCANGQLSVEDSTNNCDFALSHSTTEDRPFSAPIVWEEIIPKDFKNSTENSSMTVRKLIHQTADYLRTIKSASYPETLKIAKLIVAKFPKAFEKVTWKDGQIYSDGVNELRTVIYDRLKYQQKQLSIRGTKRRLADNEDCDESPITRKDKVKIMRFAKGQDCYGCVAFEPPLTENETIDSQKEKKKMLLKYFEEQCDTMIVTELMEKTYPSQRRCINHREENDTSLGEILEKDWPHLTEDKYFIQHADILLGKKVQDIWNLNLETKSKSIVSFFEGISFQCRKKSNVPGYMDKIRETLKIFKEKEKEVQSRYPAALVIFPLIACQFKEEELFTLMDPVSTEDDIKNAATDSSRPALIVTGSSLYDEACTCYVVIEGSIVLKSNNILKGVLLFLLSYYVYGYNYPTRMAVSLDFVQRMLLDVNPLQGHKGTKISKKAGTLINNIIEFCK
ncbi:uncharacterized protein LOC127279493 [Leptopilina boulardi]|uniref:uncharacterized protein LOC127279493 n=1 Tax=Leptopilina boulardi TaxID=63433 RepID=UPI0021F56560|nr:uncharacterized protein LOC127279493 [Leptopilina boulardi]XP_051157843.1 uncharacterized protein LOC127279493 [Leptopilina boulardi]